MAAEREHTGLSPLNEPILQVCGLHKAFGDQVVLRGVDLAIPEGQITVIIGGSGSGKSVLIKHLVALMRPDRGQVRFRGRDIFAMNDAELLSARRHFGMLFQNSALFDSMNVYDNVAFPLREHSRPAPAQEREMVMTALTDLKLGHAVGKFPSELSGGMRKRAGLARALALDPETLFLDEPTAGLDPIGAAAFDQLILDLQAALGLTVFMVTHDLDSLHTICDRIAVLADRKVKLIGPMEVMLQSEHPWVREYFHGPRARAALAATGS